ncbi:MAG: hypothetical protein MZU84_01855 [Sphingobacterium sp.]|nr:hypothetical protein [Sphingobacterium sp.]
MASIGQDLTGRARGAQHLHRGDRLGHQDRAPLSRGPGGRPPRPACPAGSSSRGSSGPTPRPIGLDPGRGPGPLQGGRPSRSEPEPERKIFPSPLQRPRRRPAPAEAVSPAVPAEPAPAADTVEARAGPSRSLRPPAASTQVLEPRLSEAGPQAHPRPGPGAASPPCARGRGRRRLAVPCVNQADAPQPARPPPKPSPTAAGDRAGSDPPSAPVSETLTPPRRPRPNRAAPAVRDSRADRPTGLAPAAEEVWTGPRPSRSPSRPRPGSRSARTASSRSTASFRPAPRPGPRPTTVSSSTPATPEASRSVLNGQPGQAPRPLGPGPDRHQDHAREHQADFLESPVLRPADGVTSRPMLPSV